MIPVDLLSLLLGITIGVVVSVIAIRAGGVKSTMRKYFDVGGDDNQTDFSHDHQAR